MRLEYVAILVVVLAVGIVTTVFVQPLEEGAISPAPPPPGPVTATISYTDEGYDPKEVTIKKGEAVRWVNDSTREMWPASNVHPTHSLYPQFAATDCLGSSFDACDRLGPGESYEFTFGVVGNWKFHDHIRPSRTGIVHVTE